MAGATVAALGIFLPVYLVVVVLAPSYKRWAKNPQLNAFVRGVTAAATGAIAGAVVVLARRSIYDLPTMGIALVSLAVLFRWKIPEAGRRTRMPSASNISSVILRSRGSSVTKNCIPAAIDLAN